MAHKDSDPIQAAPAEIPDSMKADLDRFAGRFALSAADGCKAIGISKMKFKPLRFAVKPSVSAKRSGLNFVRPIRRFRVLSVLAPPFVIA